MSEDYVWTSPEKGQKQKYYSILERQLLETPNKPLYHYTSRDVFWKIMDGESMLARHIEFSNDYHEKEIGIRKLNAALGKAANVKLLTAEALPFMICFCEKEDLLSQWRGYANEGIALEFDFSKGLYGEDGTFSTAHCYTVMHKETEGSYLSKEQGGKANIFMGAIESPYGVIYTDGSENPDSSILDRVRKISLDDMQQMLTSMIPYIKNDKFKEEAEYRLIFDMRQLAGGEYRRLLDEKYVNLDVDGVRKPNIRVKFGDQYQLSNGEKLTVYYMEQELSDRLEQLKKECKRDGISVKPIRKIRKYKMDSKEILLSAGRHQERVCYRLRRMLPEKEYKIWCDGHLPIRRIIVGPSKDAEFMQNSIREYIKTKYWAEDIRVDISEIPLRT